MSFRDILSQVAGYATRYVCVTGGEPLAQKNCLLLLNELANRGYKVSLETSGAMDVKAVDSRVIKVMDMKTPTSGESGRNLEGNIQSLAEQDQVKFVLCNRNDYDWAKQQIKKLRLTEFCEVLFSASYSQLEPSQLADWILEDQLPVRFQLQIHKILWGEQEGR